MKMTTQSVCAIIKTCAESGVSHLSLGELRVEFKGHKPVVFEYNEGDPLQQEVVAVHEIERDELAHKEEILAQMEIEDPVAYEEALLKGDLIDSKDLGDEPDEGYSGAE